MRPRLRKGAARTRLLAALTASFVALVLLGLLFTHERAGTQAAQGQARQQLLALVGVQTGFTWTTATPQYDYVLRRQALRATWFPNNAQELQKFEERTGIKITFVVGHSADKALEAAMDREALAHGGFMRLQLEEAYTSLTQKTLAFLGAATAAYDARYIVKIDDDVYLRTDRLPHALRQWEAAEADYIGCMKTGPIQTDPQYRWHEAQHEVLGSTNYFTHAWGSVYIMSGRAAGYLAALPKGMLRFFANEDVTIGSWMLALNVTHLDDRRLCEPACSGASVAVYDYPTCAGLCKPSESLRKLHADAACSAVEVDPATKQLPKLKPYFYFQRPW